MDKEILIRNGWVYGKPINDEHNKQARRIFTLLNGFGIHYGDFNLKEGDTDRSLFHFIKNDKIYYIQIKYSILKRNFVIMMMSWIIRK